MVRSFIFISLTFGLGLWACSQAHSKADQDKLKQEIRDMEASFEQAVQSKGMAAGFLEFAAEDAVLLRNNTLIKGKEAIKDRFEAGAELYERIELSWEPEFVDVSESGDLAYTYGSYIITISDSLGQTNSDTGIFHTIWKKQNDGTWKFVWD